MNKKRRTNTAKNQNTLRWSIYTILVLGMLLLLISFGVEKDPKSVVNDVYQYAMGRKDKISKNEQQWELFLEGKELEIDSLNKVLKDYQARTIPEFAKVKTSSTGLNLRSLPSTDSEVIAKIPDGEKVKLYYRDNELVNVSGDSGYWVKIQYQDIVGFVFSTYLDL